MKMLSHHSPKGQSLFIHFSTEGDVATGGYETALLIRRAILAALRYEHFFYDAEVSVTLCDGPTIRALNKQYRKKDKETDVLSFPLFERDEEEVVLEGEPVSLGDIVLNLERAGVQADELSHSIEREIAFLTIHSTLHLLGYDHELSPEDDEDMCRRQREIVSTLGLD